MGLEWLRIGVGERVVAVCTDCQIIDIGGDGSLVTAACRAGWHREVTGDIDRIHSVFVLPMTLSATLQGLVERGFTERALAISDLWSDTLLSGGEECY